MDDDGMACDCTCHDDLTEAAGCEGGCHEFYYRRPVDEVKAVRAEMGVGQECGCPAVDGVIRHQRGTCTDPAVAGLDWYADRGGNGDG